MHPNLCSLMELINCSAAESAYIAGDFTVTKKLVETAKVKARSDLDRAMI